jgi:hypothetical protein
VVVIPTDGTEQETADSSVPRLLVHHSSSHDKQASRGLILQGFHPQPFMAQPPAIPSAVDPHTVERACPRVTRWSALPDERPWHPGPGLLGSAWVVGGRDGPPSQKPEEPPPEASFRPRRPRRDWPARRPMPALAPPAGRARPAAARLRAALISTELNSAGPEALPAGDGTHG